MGLVAKLSLWYSKKVHNENEKWIKNPIDYQARVLKRLITEGKKTQFGIDHNFKNIKNYQDFKKAVSISDYEDLKPYINQVLEGKENVLWPGKPLYFCKTSETTSGVNNLCLITSSVLKMQF